MNTSHSEDNLQWLLMKSALKAKQHVMKIAEEHDLTVMQLYSLFLLEPGMQVPMNSISGLLACDPSNVTAIVDRLVAGSYIERHESPSDRRIKAIGLTPSGEAFRAEMLKRIEKDDIPHISKLSESETQTLKKLLTKIMPDTLSK
jgi:DNA-binding MarR family transcriptional regulator